MAQQVAGRRDIVQDPLRQQAVQPRPDRSVQLTGVRGPAMPSMAGFGQQQEELAKAMGGLNSVLDQMFEEQKDTWITEGKTAYMTGVAEAELMKNGNRYTQMGYQQLKARNDVDQWYMQEQADLLEKSRSMDPAAYQKYLGEKRAAFLDGISDPYAKKVAVAAFEQINPDLATKQFTQNNAYNLEQRDAEVQQYLDTGSMSSQTRGEVIPGETSLKISPTPVEPVMALSERDRDLGIKTLIGEAGNQGEFGMASVAHVLRNRATDSRYPDSLASVVLQPKQFSVWNKGKEGRASQLNALGPGNPIYDKAAKVFDTVMSGRHVDPTGGALFYHSPAGMKAYAEQGVQVSQATRNRTAAAENSAASIRIGGHVFYGKTDGAKRGLRDLVEPEEQGDTGGETAYRDPYVSAPNYQQFPGKAADDLVTSTNQQAAQNEGVSGVRDSGAPNEVLDFIRNYKGLPPDRMAKNVARSMARQLDAGNDQLFSDTGGIAILHELGADDADIDKVMKAKARYDAAQDKKYDEDDLKFEDDILRLADDPNANRDDIIGRISERQKVGLYTDEQAKSLVRNALATMRQNDAQAQSKLDAEAQKQKEATESVWANPDFQQEIGGLYQQIAANTVDYDSAQETVKEIADKYGAKPTDVEKLVGIVAEKDQQRQTALRNKAEAALASTATSEANKKEVDQALGRGYGLSNATGEVKVVDGAGNTVKMSSKEYGIQRLKQDALIRHTSQDGKVNTAAVANDFFTKLQAHGVVDPQTKAQMTAAMAGNIIDPKTKQVNSSAKEAYDLYTTLRTNPQINDGYLAEIVGDPYTRNILELAYTLDGGNLTGPEALVRAKELVEQKDFDPNARIGRDAVFASQSNTVAQSLVKEMTEPGFFNWLGGFYDSGEIERAAQFGAPMVQQRLMAAADAYHVQFPWQEPAASLELAKQDLKRDMKVVAGNIIITPDKLEQKMGLENPASVNEAVKGYIKAFGGDMFFADKEGVVFDTSKQEQADRAAYEAAPVGGVWGLNKVGAETNLPVKVQWMPNVGENGSFAFFHITDVKKGTVNTAKQVFIPAERIGAWYKQEQTSPNLFQRIWDKTRHDLAGHHRNMDAANAGAAIGAMVNQ